MEAVSRRRTRGLELDRGRTGRIHKPSLAPFGVDIQALTLPEQLRDRGLSEAVHRRAPSPKRCTSVEPARGGDAVG